MSSHAEPAGPDAPSLVALVAGRTLDAELAALVWLLVDGHVPLLVVPPPARLAAGTQLLRGALRSLGRDAEAEVACRPLDRAGAWAIAHGERAGATLGASSLEELRNLLAGPPFLLSRPELTFLGCVLILAPPDGQPAGPLRVTVAHYVRPLARDAAGHPQELPPAVLATWDEARSRYEQFAWGVLPEIAARLGRKAGDLEADLHHRRDDLAGLAAAGVTALADVRPLIAGYRAAYGAPHADDGAVSRPH
ncbi:MAG TPA: hypothetical protein VET90_01625 [Candidatus Binatus sp.]|nr:hypothetical protein [Candidatus Binatus sp.]